MRFLYLVLAALVIASPVFAQPMEAVTEDGETVILHEDGTWVYQAVVEAPSEASSKPAGSTELLESQKGFYELWYNPDVWTNMKEKLNPEAEFTLIHHTSDAYAMIIAERITMPLSSLKNVALQNAKGAAPDAKIVHEETKVVNGVELLNMRINGTVEGIPFTYYGYYWTGDAGALQAIAFTGQNLFDEYRQDFVNLLDGLVITKP